MQLSSDSVGVVEWVRQAGGCGTFCRFDIERDVRLRAWDITHAIPAKGGGWLSRGIVISDRMLRGDMEPYGRRLRVMFGQDHDAADVGQTGGYRSCCDCDVLFKPREEWMKRCLSCWRKQQAADAAEAAVAVAAVLRPPAAATPSVFASSAEYNRGYQAGYRDGVASLEARIRGQDAEKRKRPQPTRDFPELDFE